MLVARNIMDEEGGDERQFYLVADSEPWLLNVITPSRSRQEIVRARFIDPIPGVSTAFALRVSVRESSNGGLRAVLRKAGTPPPGERPLTEVTVAETHRVWCLEGPDFFTECD